ncbi:MAG: DNA mismatch repair endonuclease MutL [Lentisphaeria bacterium]|nr:DNA mismatch repair endonuclease MutL [Lentisphaeria bacterium]
MSRIRVMSRLLSNRIAAGEVIERPASVVKELVENSLDAGATEITVEIERAGNRLIAVTDNGCGMDPEDAVLALQRHGTSKLLDEKDLDHIMTLGFRGEALPSIASVSKFSLTTRPPEAAGGTQVYCEEDGELHSRPGGGAPGTRIEVRDLFCNLPARRKFLKSPATEEHHIGEVLTMLAVAHPETGFKLIIDGRTAMHTPAVPDVAPRLRELFGKNFVDNMLFFEHTEHDIHLSGCVAAPGFTRPSRREQRIFINSRPVEPQAVYRGIREGYGALAESGRFNPVVIFLEMPPDQLDVNVHPTKREVRFKSEYTVSRAVAAAVSAALRQARDPAALPAPDAADGLPLSGKLPLSLVLDAAEISYTPPTAVQHELPAVAPPSAPEAPPLPEKPSPPEELSPQSAPEPEPFPATPAATTTAEDLPAARMKFSPLVRESRPAAFSGNWPDRIIGAVDETYILGESAAGLVLIDQHAAHERIMFEKILAGAAAKKAAAQALLLPETVELPLAMVKLLEGNRELFALLGFEVESAGGAAVLVNSIPLVPCAHRPVGVWLYDMLNELLEESDRSGMIAPEFAARAACKAAVKAHEHLTLPEMETLLAQLRQCRQGTLCPHGRPTMVEVPKREIERRFGRR